MLVGVETGVLTFRMKQYSTSHSSHICYSKRFCYDFFLNHHTIALVNNFSKLLNCVVIQTVLDLVKKRINYLSSLLSTRKRTILTSSRIVLNAMTQCMFTDNYASSFCFWVFEKRLTQKNCFLFCKKYGLFNSSIFLTVNKFVLSYFPDFRGQCSGGTRSQYFISEADCWFHQSSFKGFSIVFPAP